MDEEDLNGFLKELTREKDRGKGEREGRGVSGEED